MFFNESSLGIYDNVETAANKTVAAAFDCYFHLACGFQ
jgi:hypothetical protein